MDPAIKYDEIHENLRIIRTPKIDYKIVLDRGIGLWEVFAGAVTDKGKLFDQRFTTPAQATIALRNYLDSKRPV